jgi:alpha-2-macroglobulin
VNMKLATTSRGLDVDDDEEDDGTWEDEEDDRAMGRAYNAASFIRELRDDRVLFFVDHMAAGMYRYRYLARATTLGSFVLPPTRAEEMYTPEVFGRTGADKITITPKK